VGRIREFLAALSCLRLAAGVPWMVPFFRHDAHQVLAAFDLDVSPMICGALDEPGYRARVLVACRVGSVKTGFAIWCYARMAGEPFDPCLAAMAGAFSRLYDDLLDHGDDVGFDERFSAFLADGRPRAADGIERVLYECFDAMRRRLARPPTDPVFRAVAEAHRFQVLSRIQRRADASDETIDDIIGNKGGYGALVQFGLVRAGMGGEEASVVWRIGSVCQLLDDQHDLAVDRAQGIVTGATSGRVGPLDVAREVMRLRAQLAAHYGAARTRRFSGLLCILLAGLLVRRREPWSPEPEVPAGPWRMFKGHSYTVTPVRPR
jgi:hypothetical protein